MYLNAATDWTRETPFGVVWGVNADRPTAPPIPGMLICPDGAGQAGHMRFEGLGGRVNWVIAWADRLQRRHGVLGFAYAVVKSTATMRAAGRPHGRERACRALERAQR